MKDSIIKPAKLKMGDTIGIAAPASAMYPVMEEFLNLAIKNIENLGFKLKFSESALKYEEDLNNPIYQRADDIHSLFKDPEVKAIICLCGGYSEDVREVLKVLDWKLIKQNPKIIVGYSANTVLLLGIQHRTNLVTFHGPHLLNEFSEFPKPLTYTLDHLLSLLLHKTNVENLKPPREWTTDFPKLDQTRLMKRNPGWKWLRPGIGNGRLIGGNLESIQTILETDYCPSFRSKILFIEEVYTGQPIIESIEDGIKQLKSMDIFSMISGLIVGKIYDISAEDVKRLFNLILYHTKEYDFPILAQVDIGHTDPKITLPIGIKASLDSNRNLFSLDENSVI